jgi:DNA (cytosine-5)-methyltransferase 1
MQSDGRSGFYEFFAGGGMARAGLGEGWKCLFANDFDAKKAESYRTNWGDAEFRLGDIAKLTAADLPSRADLAWASFPCQDVSLAGNGAGLAGERSGTFWAFWTLMSALRSEGRQPKLIALENVPGLLSSGKGKDFPEVVQSLVALGYRVGAMVIDAERFVPQSRPRLFIVAADRRLPIVPTLVSAKPETWTTPKALAAAVARLPQYSASQWLWWRLSQPPHRTISLADIIEERPQGVDWNSDGETERLLSMMSPLNRAKVESARLRGGRHVGTAYRRTRPDGRGGKMQRAEVRFDGIAGCLRAPGGGSSRQIVILIENGKVRSRLLSPREGARLMGLPDSYVLPQRYNDAYHLVGDGVVAAVALWLRRELLDVLLPESVSQAKPLSASAVIDFRKALLLSNVGAMTSVELCAGAGGQALGIEQAGFAHKALVEIDQHACATLRANRPEWNVLEHGVEQFNGAAFKGIDLLAGGLPCPPFSVAGKQLGTSDERNLFPHGLRIASELKPRAIFFENVRGILDPAFSDYRKFITRQLQGLGYWVDWKLLQSSDYGVPQLRPRVVLLALEKGVETFFKWPEARLAGAPSVGETLFDLMLRNGWRGAAEWSKNASKIAPTIVGGSKKHGGPDLGPTRARRAWAELGVNGKSIAPEAPEKDFAGMPRLTVRMVARLQGFPDSWEFSGKKTNAYRQVGNAFPPPVARAVALQIRNALAARDHAEKSLILKAM